MDRAAGRCRGRAGARGKRGAGARERRSRVLGTGSAHSEKISGHPGLTASMGCVGAVRAHDSRCMRGRTTSGTMHEVSFLASQFERASEPRVRFIAQINIAREEAPQKKKKKNPPKKKKKKTRPGFCNMGCIAPKPQPSPYQTLSQVST